MLQQVAEPKTLAEAIKYFADPDRCLEFLIPLRWPSGIACPRCACADHSFLKTRRIWKCKGCKRQFSIKVGTVMEDSPIKLSTWLCAIWMIANCRNGISSYEIHRGLGVCQKTAWFLLHRVRYAMKAGTFTKLSGTVECDESYIGGRAEFMHKSKREKAIKGRGTAGKAIVMGILERGGKVRARTIPNTKMETLHREVEANVEPGSHVMTDPQPGYRALNATFDHDTVNHSAGEYVRGAIHTNGIENFWSLLKRAIKGTYISVNAEHLDAYADEQAFRYNVRELKDGVRFTTATSGITGKRLTYKRLTGKA
ncbi:MAG: IS1595 family transposase [Gemmataceae bacterium]